MKKCAESQVAHIRVTANVCVLSLSTLTPVKDYGNN